eukprot:9737885-Prorocentrum_lima.AAC.1
MEEDHQIRDNYRLKDMHNFVKVHNTYLIKNLNALCNMAISNNGMFKVNNKCLTKEMAEVLISS